MSIAHVAYEQRVAEIAEVRGRYRQAPGLVQNASRWVSDESLQHFGRRVINIDRTRCRTESPQRDVDVAMDRLDTVHGQPSRSVAIGKGAD